MKCEEAGATLIDLIDEPRLAERQGEILAHLQACTTCAGEFSAYRDLLALVQADPVPEPSGAFWEEFLPSLKRRIGRELSSSPQQKVSGRLTGLRSWLAFPRPLVAGVAVAAISVLILIRLPGLLAPKADRSDTPSSFGRVMESGGGPGNLAEILRTGNGMREPGEPLVVAGEVLDDPSTLAAIIQRLPWVDEIADRIEYAWVWRLESDPRELLASLSHEDQQLVLDHLRSF